MQVITKETISCFRYSNFIVQEVSDKITKAINDFALRVLKIPSVAKIAYKSEGNVITIWTFTKKTDRNNLFKIYAIEQKMMEKFPDLIFDFTVIFGGKELPEGFNEISSEDIDANP